MSRRCISVEPTKLQVQLLFTLLWLDQTGSNCGCVKEAASLAVIEKPSAISLPAGVIAVIFSFPQETLSLCSFHPWNETSILSSFTLESQKSIQWEFLRKGFKSWKFILLNLCSLPWLWEWFLHCEPVIATRGTKVDRLNNPCVAY